MLCDGVGLGAATCKPCGSWVEHSPHPELPTHGAFGLVSRRSSGRPQAWGAKPGWCLCWLRPINKQWTEGPGSCQEISLKAPPPYSSFSSHQAPSPAEMQDPWLESKQRPGSSNDLPTDAGDKKGGGRGKKAAPTLPRRMPECSAPSLVA